VENQVNILDREIFCKKNSSKKIFTKLSTQNFSTHYFKTTFEQQEAEFFFGSCDFLWL
jgi:hypothetical protein